MNARFKVILGLVGDKVILSFSLSMQLSLTIMITKVVISKERGHCVDLHYAWPSGGGVHRP